MKLRVWRALPGFLLVLLGTALTSQGTPDVKLDSLAVGLEVYSNVTVLDTTKTDVFIKHAGGSANLKIKDLAPETLKQLSGQAEPRVATVETAETAEENDPAPAQAAPAIAESPPESPDLEALQQEWLAALEQIRASVSTEVLVAVGTVFLMFYLFLCYCCKLIVQKTGNEAGLLIWLPFLQMIPLFRAAGMSGWWFILWLLPVLNLFASVIWCFKIVEQRGKNVAWAFLLLLPATNVLAFFYLAFSEGVELESEPERIRLAEAA